MKIDTTESRYDRQERITWWDQSKLGAANVLVVGAGALGNEIVKNLALVGVGHIDIVDMDSIEYSNLARCALFRDSDAGRPKAEALAEAAGQINPDVQIHGYVGTVQSLGSAWLRRYDVVIAGLDSREARLWLNGACRKLGITWIDGAIEGLQGIVRMFGSEGPCYDCTLGEKDREVISHRRSCALLTPEELVTGKTPTNSTSASVIAGLEVQEAIKFIVGRKDLLALEGKVWRLDGETMMTSVTQYMEDPECLSHDFLKDWLAVDTPPESLQALVSEVETKVGASVDALYFVDDVITIEPCASCGEGDRVVGLRPLMVDGAGRCLACGNDRPVHSQTSMATNDTLINLPWYQWAWPRLEVITLRMNDFDGSYLNVELEGGRVHV